MLKLNKLYLFRWSNMEEVRAEDGCAVSPMKSINLKYSFFICYFFWKLLLLFRFSTTNGTHVMCRSGNRCEIGPSSAGRRGIGFELWKSLNILEWGSYQLSHESTDSGQKLNKEAPLLLLSTRPPHSCTKKVYFFEFIVRVSAVVNCYFSHNLPHLIIMDFASGEQM